MRVQQFGKNIFSSLLAGLLFQSSLALTQAQLSGRGFAAPQSTQDATSWVEVTPQDESFRVTMPAQPTRAERNVPFRSSNVAVRAYSASNNDGVRFIVYSLRNLESSGAPPYSEAFLDSAIVFVWNRLLEPERRGRTEEARLRQTEIQYQRTLELPGRQYRFTVSAVPGVVRVYRFGREVFAVIALNALESNADARRFLESFVTLIGRPASPETGGIGSGRVSGTGPGTGAGIGPGSGAPIDSMPLDLNQPVPTRRLTERVRILEKPEPSYTEEARLFQVAGMVVLRALFSVSGEVQNIAVVQRLPHGLTEEAIAAARRIRFVPAKVNDRSVSTYVTLQYSFSLY